MRFLFQFVTEDVLTTLRALLVEIQRLASAVLDAGFDVLARILSG